MDEWISVVLAAPMVYWHDDRQRDTLNRVTFNPIATGALRLDVQLQSKWSAGILKWRVDGIYTKAAVIGRIQMAFGVAP